MWNDKTFLPTKKGKRKVKNQALKKESTALRPTIWIGKGGVDQNVISQVMTQVKVKNLIKVKIQKLAYNKENIEEIIHQIIQKANVVLVDKRGRTFTIAKAHREG